MTEDSLQDLVSYPASSYESIDLAGLAAFALKVLLHRQVPTTFENIVVTAFRLFPTKFSLEGFPNYPDAARVNRTLLQLTPKYRNWARGSVQAGFTLTHSGLTKVTEVEASLSGQGLKEPRGRRDREGRGRTHDLAKDVAQIRASSLYQKWATGQLTSATQLEFLDMLGAYAYIPPRALRDRVIRIEQTAQQVGDTDTTRFLRAVKVFFADMLRET